MQMAHKHDPSPSPSPGHKSLEDGACNIDSAWTNDPRNPFNWPVWKKWSIMAISYWVTIWVGINATSYTTAAMTLAEDFNVDNSFVDFSFFAVTSWNATAAIVPLATLPMMETFGFRIVYVISYVLFVVFIIPQSVAQNFATMVVCRVFAGAFGGTTQNAADAVAANLFFTAQERILPLTLYAFSLMFGVTIGPVVGALVKPLGWRWVFWFQLIINGVTIPLVYLGMKESRGSVLQPTYYPEKKDNTDGPSALARMKDTVARAAMLLTTEPTVTSFTAWSAFSFGLVFISTQSITVVMSSLYGWQVYSAGLVEVAIVIGEMLGTLAFLSQSRIYVRSADHNPEKPGVPVPESILHISIPSTIICLAGGLFMYGWSTLGTHWIVPSIGLTLVGFAITTIITSASVYITDAYSGYAASAIAAVAFGENAFAAFLPLAAKPMYLRLGFQWASSLLAFIALALALAPTTLLWKGKTIRSRSKAIKKMSLV